MYFMNFEKEFLCLCAICGCIKYSHSDIYSRIKLKRFFGYVEIVMVKC